MIEGDQGHAAMTSPDVAKANSPINCGAARARARCFQRIGECVR